MKRTVLIPLIVLILASVACSLGGLTGGDTPAASQQEGNPPAATQAPKYQPTQPEATPTEAPRDEVEGFEDEFDVINTDWSDVFTVTTQALNGKMFSTVKLEDGKLTFALKDNETYQYKFYKNPFPADVIIDAKYQAGGYLFNGIALVCRANSDMTQWYEFRVSSESKYAIYLFDQSLRDSGKNPYISLKQGVVAVETLAPTKENELRAVCDGTSLILEANQVQIANVQDTTLSEGGMAGVGAMSGSLTPVTVWFDYFHVTQP